MDTFADLACCNLMYFSLYKLMFWLTIQSRLASLIVSQAVCKLVHHWDAWDAPSETVIELETQTTEATIDLVLSVELPSLLNKI